MTNYEKAQVLLNAGIAKNMMVHDVSNMEHYDCHIKKWEDE